jgi:hypothetical protein
MQDFIAVRVFAIMISCVGSRDIAGGLIEHIDRLYVVPQLYAIKLTLGLTGVSRLNGL